MQFFERRYDELEEVRSERTSQESYAASPTSKGATVQVLIGAALPYESGRKTWLRRFFYGLVNLSGLRSRFFP
jgi:hypothetical protein